MGFGRNIPNKTLLIDVWPAMPPLSSTRRKRGEIAPPEMKFMQLSKLQHFDVSAMFQRILRVSSISIWDTEIVDTLIKYNSRHFAKERNVLHYDNHRWIFNDIHQYEDQIRFFSEMLEQRHTNFENQSPGVSVLLAFLLLNMGHALFRDIAINVPILCPELELMEQSLELDCHTLFAGFSGR